MQELIHFNIPEGLTFDDVLLVPARSEVLPREVNISSHFTRDIVLHTPIVSAAMDTVTEAATAISMAREGGIGVIHKNMSIAEQAAEVRRVKRAENGLDKSKNAIGDVLRHLYAAQLLLADLDFKTQSEVKLQLADGSEEYAKDYLPAKIQSVLTDVEY